jgi:hypothetical protein
LLLACNFGFIAILSAILRYSRRARVYFSIPNDVIIFKEIEVPNEVKKSENSDDIKGISKE